MGSKTGKILTAMQRALTLRQPKYNPDDRKTYVIFPREPKEPDPYQALTDPRVQEEYEARGINNAYDPRTEAEIKMDIAKKLKQKKI